METLIGAAGLAVVVVALVTWQCSDWIEARADEARERARKLKLENDRLARELNDSPGQSGTSSTSSVAV